MPTDLKVRLTEEADARLISLNALIVEKLSNGQPRALAQPARADEPEPLVKSRVTVQAPKADIPLKVVPKIAGLGARLRAPSDRDL